MEVTIEMSIIPSGVFEFDSKGNQMCSNCKGTGCYRFHKAVPTELKCCLCSNDDPTCSFCASMM